MSPLPRIGAWAFAIVATAVCAPTADGQGAAPYNRLVETIAITPSPPIQGGGYDVTAIWKIRVGPTSAPLNLSTVGALEVNGVEVARRIVQAEVAGGSGSGCGDFTGCQGGCGSVSLGGGAVNLTLLCQSDGPCIPDCNDCFCQTAGLQLHFPGVDLDPDDVVEVVLAPAPGALPETDTSDDRDRHVFDGSPVFWEVFVEEVRVSRAPTRAASTVEVDWGFAASGLEGTHNLGLLVLILVAGQQVAEFTACGDWLVAPTGNLCLACDGSSCGSTFCDGDEIPLRCILVENDWGQALCGCGATQTASFVVPGVDPDDDVVVLLRPAPGALPPLPGFPGDDEGRPCPPPACPEDLNGDGVVGSEDLGALIAAWGECFPV